MNYSIDHGDSGMREPALDDAELIYILAKALRRYEYCRNHSGPHTDWTALDDMVRAALAKVTP